jgi:hypothetical protein
MPKHTATVATAFALVAGPFVSTIADPRQAATDGLGPGQAKTSAPAPLGDRLGDHPEPSAAAMMEAARGGHIEDLATLLEGGADLSARDEQRKGVLHWRIFQPQIRLEP